jgi:hypothetical protein
MGLAAAICERPETPRLIKPIEDYAVTGTNNCPFHARGVEKLLENGAKL